MSDVAMVARHSDEASQQRAEVFVRDTLGDGDDVAVVWDPVHHLQGHCVVDGREVVVIAPRDSSHVPVLFSPAEFDALRHRCRDEKTTSAT